MSKPRFVLVEAQRPGAIGQIAGLHGRSCADLSGFGLSFEALMACELAGACEALRPGRDQPWLALVDESIEGCVAVQASEDGDSAHLRWFPVSSALRGQGAGRGLLSAALTFCGAAGVRRLDLWTFAGLDAARHLYEAAGFRLVAQQAGRRWGSETLEQRFELVLG